MAEWGLGTLGIFAAHLRLFCHETAVDVHGMSGSRVGWFAVNWREEWVTRGQMGPRVVAGQSPIAGHDETKMDSVVGRLSRRIMVFRAKVARTREPRRSFRETTAFGSGRG